MKTAGELTASTVREMEIAGSSQMFRFTYPDFYL
jgi:hypothetical protein